MSYIKLFTFISSLTLYSATLIIGVGKFNKSNKSKKLGCSPGVLCQSTDKIAYLAIFPYTALWITYISISI